QKSQDALVNTAQRLLHRTSLRMPAHGVFREAIREHDGSVDCPYHLECRDQTGMSGQPVPAVRAVFRHQESALAQLLQKFRKYRQGDAANVRNLLGAHSSACLPLAVGKMSESNQTVICLFCKSEHFLNRMTASDSGGREPN